MTSSGNQPRFPKGGAAHILMSPHEPFTFGSTNRVLAALRLRLLDGATETPAQDDTL